MLPCPEDPATAERCLVHVLEMPECMLFTSEGPVHPEGLRRELFDMTPAVQAGHPLKKICQILLWRRPRNPHIGEGCLLAFHLRYYQTGDTPEADHDQQPGSSQVMIVSFSLLFHFSGSSQKKRSPIEETLKAPCF